MTKEFLLYTLFVNIPAFFILTYFYAYFFEFKYKMPVKMILLYTVLISLFDSTLKSLEVGNLQTPLSTFGSIFLISIIFRINPITAILTNIIGTICFLIMQIPSFLIFGKFGVTANMIFTDIKYQIPFTFSYIPVILIMTYFVHKAFNPVRYIKEHFTFFKIHDLLSDTKFETYMEKNFALLTPLCVILFIVLSTSFAALTSNITNPTFYFIFTLVSFIALAGAYLWVYRKANEYKEFETMYRACREDYKAAKAEIKALTK